MRLWGGGGLAIALAACSGEPAQQCPASQPCGGDLVGSWRITGGCAVPADAVYEIALVWQSLFQTSCPGLHISAISNVQSGTVTFGSDLTFTASTSVTGWVTATIPASCHEGSGCGEVQGVLAGAGYVVQSCVGASDCDCTLDWSRGVIGSGSGVYTTSDSVLALSADYVSRRYCVEGSTLHVFRISESAGIIVNEVLLEAE